MASIPMIVAVLRPAVIAARLLPSPSSRVMWSLLTDPKNSYNMRAGRVIAPSSKSPPVFTQVVNEVIRLVVTSFSLCSFASISTFWVAGSVDRLGTPLLTTLSPWFKSFNKQENFIFLSPDGAVFAPSPL